MSKVFGTFEDQLRRLRNVRRTILNPPYAVEIFSRRQPKTKRAYGWSFGEGAEARYTAIFEIPPVNWPSTVVKASIADEAKK